jgi:hypothetical protein
MCPIFLAVLIGPLTSAAQVPPRPGVVGQREETKPRNCKQPETYFCCAANSEECHRCVAGLNKEQRDYEDCLLSQPEETKPHNKKGPNVEIVRPLGS